MAYRDFGGREKSRRYADLQKNSEDGQTLDGNAHPHRARLLSEIGEKRTEKFTVDTVEEMGTRASARESDTCRIISVHPEGSGEWMAVELYIPLEESHLLVSSDAVTCDGDGESCRVIFHLTIQQYTALRPKTGAVSFEGATSLLEAGRLSEALRMGMEHLSRSSLSQKGLGDKLTAKGVSRDIAFQAAACLAEEGMIREEDTALLRVEQGLRKGWGPRRIREDLRAKGFASDSIGAAMSTLRDVDHVKRLVAVIRKKYGGIPADRRERDKMVAALLRLGYGMDTVRHAMERLGDFDRP